jgi:hypothetical protein
MNTPTNDDFVVLWKKRFTEEQLWESKQRLPYNITAQVVEDQLADIERKTNGLLKYSFTEGLTQTRFVLTTKDGAKGIDITIKQEVSGVAGWGYYNQLTRQQRDAWLLVGKTVQRLIDTDLDKRAAEQLILEQGRDAFEDTDLTVSVGDKPLEEYVVNVVGWRPDKFRQSVQDLVNTYSVTAAPNVPKPSRKPPGRHVDAENETAYRVIVEGGNTEEAADKAFDEWYRAKGIKDPTQKDRDNFNISMTRAAERAQRSNPPPE